MTKIVKKREVRRVYEPLTQSIDTKTVEKADVVVGTVNVMKADMVVQAEFVGEADFTRLNTNDLDPTKTYTLKFKDGKMQWAQD